MVLKTPERARRCVDDVPAFGDALGFVELVRDAARGKLRVDRLGGARRGLEHALLPINVQALGAELLLRDERVCVNSTSEVTRGDGAEVVESGRAHAPSPRLVTHSRERCAWYPRGSCQ